jgi:hypothetical protein
MALAGELLAERITKKIAITRVLLMFNRAATMSTAREIIRSM